MSSQVSSRNCPSPVALERLFFAFGSPSDSTPIIRLTTASIAISMVGSSTDRESEAQYDTDALGQSITNVFNDVTMIINDQSRRPWRTSVPQIVGVEHSC